MANLLIKDMDNSLLAKVNYAARMAGKTQTQWVIEVLTEASDGNGPNGPNGVLVRGSVPRREGQGGTGKAGRRPHDPKTCVVYRCSLCLAAGKKF